MHINTGFTALAALAASGARAVAIQNRQQPNPPQLELTTHGNRNCANQNFNGLPLLYVVLTDDIGKCRTLFQDKDHTVGSIGVSFAEGFENDTCVFQTYTDTECKEGVQYHMIGQCAQNLINEDVCPRPTGPKSFIYSC